MDDMKFYSTHNFTNTPITRLLYYTYEIEGKVYGGMKIEGDFNASEKEYRHYDMYFTRIDSAISEKEFDIAGGYEVKNLIVEQQEKQYHFLIELEPVLNNSDRQNNALSVEAYCESYIARGRHYRGIDYTNVYGTPEYEKINQRSFYAENDKYFQEEEVTELPDGYSLLVKSYMHRTEHAIHAEFNRCRLYKGEECLYEYISTDGHHFIYKDFIAHSNGHRYYPFHINLYGISYIDVDTLEVFNYIPKGYDNDFGAPNGESFIVTAVHYNPVNDIIAYDGCYWAGWSDVMIGDFSNPLSFDPHLVSVHDILEHNEDDIDDIVFLKWDGSTLVVKNDAGENETIDVDTIRKAIEMKKNGRIVSGIYEN